MSNLAESVSSDAIWGTIQGTVANQLDLVSYLAGLYLPLAGGTMTGDLDMDGHNVLSAGGLSADTVDATAIDATTSLTLNSAPVATEAFASNASNLSSGTVPDARLSGNVPRLNAASNAFTGNILASANGTQNIGNTTNYFGALHVGTIRTPGALTLNTAGTGYGLIATGDFGFWDTNSFNIRSSASATRFTVNASGVTATDGIVNIGTGVSILRNATGPTAETRAAGGLRVCNQDGSALGPVACSQITFSSSSHTIVSNGAGSIKIGIGGSDSVQFVSSSSGVNHFNGYIEFGGGFFSPRCSMLTPSVGTVQMRQGDQVTPIAIDCGSITTSGTLRVGGGTIVQNILSATATLDFPSIAASSFADLTITVTGAVSGDTVIVNPIAGSATTDVVYTGWVSAANTVTIRASNVSSTTARDPASGTFRATVVRF